MTNETPAKILSLLGVALTSMFLLFVVSATNASFAGMESGFPDPFAPRNVIAVLETDPFAPERVAAGLDNLAAGYGRFVDAVYVRPIKSDFAMYRENVSWVIDESADSILKITGLASLAQLPTEPQVYARGRVAGSQTGSAPPQHKQGLNMDSIYSFFIR